MERKQDSYNQFVYCSSIPGTKKLSILKSKFIRDRSHQIWRITKKTKTFKKTKDEKQFVYCILRCFYVELYQHCACVVLQSCPRLILFCTGSKQLPGGGLLAARFIRAHESTSPITTRLRPNTFQKHRYHITRFTAGSYTGQGPALGTGRDGIGSRPIPYEF